MTDTSTLDRLEGLVRRLERLGVNPTDSVTPLTVADFPPTVASGELIESAWGNAVRHHLRVDGGFNAVIGLTTQTVGMRDVLTFTIPPVAEPTVLIVGGDVHIRSDTAGQLRAYGDLFQGVAGVCTTGPFETSVGGTWISCVMQWGWNIPANADPSYKLRCSISNLPLAPAVGYIDARSWWTQYLL